MTGNFIDTFRLGKSKLPDNKADVQLIETDYSRLRVLETKGDRSLGALPDCVNLEILSPGELNILAFFST